MIPNNPNPYQSIHFVGALTGEMAALAMFTAAQKIKVSASDDHSDTLYLPLLEKAGVTFYDMFAQANISKSTEAVVLSPYYDTHHVEASSAQKNKIPVISATEYLKLLSQNYRRLAILGDYDGPIIAAMLNHVWNQAYIAVTGITNCLIDGERNTKSMDADWFTLPLSGFKRDASTYEANFLSHDAELVIIPCIRYDYPELNMTLDDVYQSYYKFVKRIPRKGLIIGNGDYSRMKRLRTHLVDRHIETYGFDRDCNWQIRDVTTGDGSINFSLFRDRKLYGPFSVTGAGEAIIYAAAATSVASLLMDVKPESLGNGLASMPRLTRYFRQHISDGRVIIDDRADHPETITSVLQNIKTLYPTKKIWCVYQPGSFLRTKALYEEFQQSLSLADNVYILDIHGYPKEKSEGLHIRHFISDMKRRFPHVYYLDNQTDIVAMLQDRVPLSDCIVTLGVDTLWETVGSKFVTDTPE